VIGDALVFLLTTLGNLFAIAVLLRFAMQAARVSFKNPFSVFVVALTDFAVRPLRRIVPGLFGVDMASLVVACYWLEGFPFALAGGGVWGVLLGLAVVRLVSLAVYLVIGLTLIRAILSWMNSFSPLTPVVIGLTEPFLRPLRRVIPSVANVDLTPIALFIVCQLVLMVPVQALERVLLNAL
jgi:YggT family protein